MGKIDTSDVVVSVSQLRLTHIDTRLPALCHGKEKSDDRIPYCS